MKAVIRTLGAVLALLTAATSTLVAQTGPRDPRGHDDRRPPSDLPERVMLRAPRYPPPVGKPHPPLALWDLKHEQPVSITTYRGKKVLLIHFATWSRVCREEVPRWYAALQKHVDDGKLVIVGIVQEQHPDRAALFAQWKKISGPLLQDPVDYLLLKSVPVFVCIDENGYVRSVKPELETIEKKFINRKYPGKPARILENTEEPPNTVVTRRYAHDSRMADDLIEHGEALLIAGAPPQIKEAIESYSEAIKKDKKNARAFFGLGVAHQMRHDGPDAESTDRKAALDAWARAVELAPRNEIYRARLVENSPPEKGHSPPYAWIKTARKQIAERGDTPEPLAVDPFAEGRKKEEARAGDDKTEHADTGTQKENGDTAGSR